MIDSDMKKITNLLYMLAVLLLASCNDFSEAANEPLRLLP